MGRLVTTVGAFASVRMLRSSIILDAHDRGPEQAPSLVVTYDEADSEYVERRFALLRAGAAAVPAGADFVASFQRRGCGPEASGVYCLFELVGEEIPAEIPPEAHRHFQHLKREGFALEHVAGLGPRWRAPDDAGGLSQSDVIALTELREYGYGSVVNA